MSYKKTNKKSSKSKKENKATENLLDDDIMLEEVLFIKESYCMACDSPLRSYSSLICPECLEEGADMFSSMIDNKNNTDYFNKSIFIDPEFKPDTTEEDIDEEEVFEEEDIDPEFNNQENLKISLILKGLSCKDSDE